MNMMNMMNIEFNDNRFSLDQISNPLEWNDLMKRCPETDLSQAWITGDAINACYGWKPMRHLISYHDHKFGMVQTLQKEIPLICRVTKINGGPLYFDTHKKYAVHMDLRIEAIRYLHDYWVKKNKSILYISPCIEACSKIQESLTQIGFVCTDEDPWASIVIDLDCDEAELKKKMSRRFKNSVKKMKKSGLELTVENSDKAFSFLIEQYRHHIMKHRFAYPPPVMVEKIWENCTDKNCLDILFAKKKDLFAGAMMIISYANTAYGFIAVNSDEGKMLNSHTFLIWEAIRLYKKKKYRWFDLGGISEKRLPGITAYKRGTGGMEFTRAGHFKSDFSTPWLKIVEKSISAKNYFKEKYL